MPETPANPPPDVRMRGFQKRTPVTAALQWLDNALDDWLADRNRQVSAPEVLPIHECCGRVLAQDLVSNLAVPGFERAMMDGYAVRSEDLAAVSADHSARLVVIGESLPGRPFAGDVACGGAVRIMTGAPFPLGADAVIPVELTQQTADSHILILGKVSPGKHVGRVGEDISKGERLLAAGRKLRPQDVAAASSIGVRMLPVFQRPRVRIVLTGSELLPAGSVPAGYQITDSNGPLLQSIVLRDTGLQIPVEYIGDDSDRLRQVLAEPTDILLVSGGSSVGQEDFAPRVLAEHGELAIHGLALRPAAPTGLGRSGSSLVFLLPGNPVSCLCAGDLFAGRALRRMQGGSGGLPYPRQMLTLGAAVTSAAGRLDYVRVRREGDRVFPLAASGAAMLGTAVRADGFVWIAEDRERCEVGDEVEYFAYDS
jgi:molybdopterin molybdotransferase